MDEYILSAVVRLDEAESLLRIEKLDCAYWHDGLQQNADRRGFPSRRAAACVNSAPRKEHDPSVVSMVG
jgi:hypothetical protein